MIIGRSAGVLSQLRFLVSVHKIAGKNRLAPQLRGAVTGAQYLYNLMILLKLLVLELPIWHSDLTWPDDDWQDN